MIIILNLIEEKYLCKLIYYITVFLTLLSQETKYRMIALTKMFWLN